MSHKNKNINNDFPSDIEGNEMSSIKNFDDLENILKGESDSDSDESNEELEKRLRMETKSLYDDIYKNDISYDDGDINGDETNFFIKKHETKEEKRERLKKIGKFGEKLESTQTDIYDFLPNQKCMIFFLKII